MRRFVLILYSKAHWIMEAEEFPDFPPDPDGNPLIFVEITDRPEVQEGWDYNAETGEFTPSVVPEPEGTPVEEVEGEADAETSPDAESVEIEK